jgi:hypothetical protein
VTKQKEQNFHFIDNLKGQDLQQEILENIFFLPAKTNTEDLEGDLPVVLLVLPSFFFGCL